MIRDSILQDLRNGVPWDDLKRKHRSQSQMYEAFRIFSEEMHKRLNDMRENLRKIQEKLSEKNTEFQRVQSEWTKVDDDVAKLRREKQGLAGEVANMTKKRDGLRLEVTGLVKKGFSPKILEELKSVEARSGQELLARVKTAEKYDQLEKKLACLEKRITELTDKIQALEEQKKIIEQQLVSEGNTLDELKRRMASYREAVEIVESVLKEGYRPGDVKSVMHGLEVFGIKGDPRGSVARLVDGLERMKTLSAVDEKVTRKEQELADVSRALARAKDELAVIRETTLKSVGEALEVSKQVIAGVGEQARNETLETARKFELRADETISKVDAKLQEMVERQRAEVKELTEFEHRKAEVEQVLGPGLALAGALKSPEDLKKVPAFFVMQLLESILSWVEMNMPPDSLVMPTEAIAAKDRSLRTYHSYKPVSLIELLKEAVKQFMIQQGKNGSQWVVRR